MSSCRCYLACAQGAVAVPVLRCSQGAVAGAGQGALCVLKVLWWLLAVLVLRCRVLVKVVLVEVLFGVRVLFLVLKVRGQSLLLVLRCRQGATVGAGHGAVWRAQGAVAPARGDFLAMRAGCCCGC